MKKIFQILAVFGSLALLASSCSRENNIYHAEEYVMFADTLKTYPVQQDVEYFSVPVVSTVTKDYDRTFGVEILDRMSNATEGLHYRLESNTVTIKAGQTAQVSIKLGSDAFEFYEPSVDGLALRHGNYRILYGSSSRDEDLKAVDMKI